MDTTTVLEIIEMIDNRLNTLREECYNTTNPDSAEEAVYWEKASELNALREHLQGYVELLVSAVENNTGE